MKMETENREGTKKGKKLRQLLKASGRVLSKVGDFCVRNLTDCSNHLNYGIALPGPAGHVPVYLPRSYSVGSTASSNGEDDSRELLRAASIIQKSPMRGNNRVEVEAEFRIEAARKSPMAEERKNVVGRSQSVKIGRIDEEKAYEFDGEDCLKVSNNSVQHVNYAYPRSKSYAVR